jgi:hypothetical protein
MTAQLRQCCAHACMRTGQLTQLAARVSFDPAHSYTALLGLRSQVCSLLRYPKVQDHVDAKKSQNVSKSPSLISGDPVYRRRKASIACLKNANFHRGRELAKKFVMGNRV